MVHLLWTEKYRPKTIEECILPERLKKPFQEYVTQENIPNLLLFGGAGVGKTTVAKAMCNEIGCDFLIINGSSETGIDVVRNKIANYASSMSFSGGRKVIIIDEADYLSPNAQAAFRNAIEELQSIVRLSLLVTLKTKSLNRYTHGVQSLTLVLKQVKRLRWLVNSSNESKTFFQKNQLNMNLPLLQS